MPLTANAQHLSHSTLRKIRQADELSIDAIARQVRQENYRDWRAWERSLDFADVMRGRYHTHVTEEGFCLTSESSDADPTPQRALPLAHYWTQCPASPPEAPCERTRPMDLLKISVSKDARLRKDTLAERRLDTTHPWSVEDFDALMRDARSLPDNVRLALAYRLRDWQHFESHAGETCRAIATPTKGVKGLDVWVHVQCRGRDTVQYSQEPVLQIVGNGTSQPVQVTISQSGYAYQDLVRAIGSAESLQTFGESHLFEADLRTLCKGLLEAACTPLWPGVLLVLTNEARQTIAALRTLLRALDAGTVTLSLLSLDNTPANREALARELAQGFTEQWEKLTERLGYPAPNIPAVQAEYEALSRKIALVEDILGVELDCLEAQMGVETLLMRAA